MFYVINYFSKLLEIIYFIFIYYFIIMNNSLNKFFSKYKYKILTQNRVGRDPATEKAFGKIVPLDSLCLHLSFSLKPLHKSA